jgi:hypothetical protein
MAPDTIDGVRREGLAILFAAQNLNDFGRPDQTADVGCKYAVGASFHGSPP